MSGTRHFCHTLLETTFFLDRFTENPQILNFMRVGTVGEGASCSVGTDEHDDANRRFSQLREVE